MTQNINQFAMAAQLGMLDLRFNVNTLSAKVDATSGGSLIAGQPVKIVSSGPSLIPSVVETQTNTDDVFGFINYDIKSESFNVGDKIEISVLQGNVMYMLSSAAITQNGQVMISGTIGAPTVVTATAAHMVIGRAMDAATASGQLIRVAILLPGFLHA
jgi:hypothetical protein